ERLVSGVDGGRPIAVVHPILNEFADRLRKRASHEALTLSHGPLDEPHYDVAPLPRSATPIDCLKWDVALRVLRQHASQVRCGGAPPCRWADRLTPDRACADQLHES